MNIVLLILLGHWIGDFVFQSSSMAKQKSHSLKWLTIHVMIYCLILFLTIVPVFGLLLAAKFIAINGALHWITDFFTSKLSVKHQDNPRIFYPILGFDQLVHTAGLIYTYEIFLM